MENYLLKTRCDLQYPFPERRTIYAKVVRYYGLGIGLARLWIWLDARSSQWPRGQQWQRIS